MKKLDRIALITIMTVSTCITPINVSAERNVRFKDNLSTIEIIDESAEKPITTPYKAETKNDVINMISKGLEGMVNSDTKDAKILNALRITGNMDKKIGEDFIEKTAPLFSTDVVWNVELELSKVNEDDDTANVFVVIKSDSLKPSLLTMEFFIEGKHIINVMSY